MKLEHFYIVSLPIGNLEDITLRGIRVLKESEAIIVENFRTAKKHLDLLKIEHSDKTFLLLNAKTREQEGKLLEQLIFKYSTVSLISDAGAPVFEDPGQTLIAKLIEYQVPFTFVPGANSLISALVLSGFHSNQFLYAGFLPQKKEQRQLALKKYIYQKTLLVFFETPYRLNVLLGEFKKAFPSGVKVAICFALTTKQEHIFRGKLNEAFKKYSTTKNQYPFVFILDNRTKSF